MLQLNSPTNLQPQLQEELFATTLHVLAGPATQTADPREWMESFVTIGEYN